MKILSFLLLTAIALNGYEPLDRGHTDSKKGSGTRATIECPQDKNTNRRKDC